MENRTSVTCRIAPITLILAISSILCVTLLMFRIYLSSSVFYTFFVWNLFLAWIPLFLSHAVLKMEEQGRSIWGIAFLFFSWLLFFPNSPYILTDLFHLKKIQNIPLWYDLVMIMSFAWNGLMIGYISLLNIQKFLNKKFNTTASWIIVVFILSLSAFGIYLGRFERWNSWDIITHPFMLLDNVFEKFANPLSHPKTMGVTLFFSIFLITSYVTLFYLIETKHHEK